MPPSNARAARRPRSPPPVLAWTAMPWVYTPEGDTGSYGAFWLLIDTFAAGLTAFLLAIQWRWYISARRDVKLLKKNRLLGVLDRAVLREVDISDFALLGREKKPEQPKVRTSRAAAPA